MTDTLWRLAWALPLVLITGLAAVLVLKKIVVPALPADPAARRMTLRERMSVSGSTSLYLIEVDGQAYLLVESPAGTVLQQAAPKTEAAQPRAAFGPLWVRRFRKGLLR
jgi:flagellar biogenesis protein FliO